MLLCICNDRLCQHPRIRLLKKLYANYMQSGGIPLLIGCAPFRNIYEQISDVQSEVKDIKLTVNSVKVPARQCSKAYLLTLRSLVCSVKNNGFCNLCPAWSIKRLAVSNWSY